MCRRGIADWANDVKYGAARSEKSGKFQSRLMDVMKEDV